MGGAASEQGSGQHGPRNPPATRYDLTVVGKVGRDTKGSTGSKPPPIHTRRCTQREPPPIPLGHLDQRQQRSTQGQCLPRSAVNGGAEAAAPLRCGQHGDLPARCKLSTTKRKSTRRRETRCALEQQDALRESTRLCMLEIEKKREPRLID